MYEPDPHDENLTPAERELALTLGGLEPAPTTVSIAEVAYQHGVDAGRRTVRTWRYAAAAAVVAATFLAIWRPVPPVVERVVIREVPAESAPRETAPSAVPDIRRIDSRTSAGHFARVASYRTQRDRLIGVADSTDVSLPLYGPTLEPAFTDDLPELPPLLGGRGGAVTLPIIGGLGDTL